MDMGTSGVPWKGNKTAIIDALKKRSGVISHAAKDLGVNRHTLTKRIQEDEELQVLTNELRNDLIEKKLDTAEDTIIYAMGRRGEDLGNALRASFFVLNNLGRRRGYIPPRMMEKEQKENYSEMRCEIIMEGEIQRRVANILKRRGIDMAECMSELIE